MFGEYDFHPILEKGVFQKYRRCEIKNVFWRPNPRPPLSSDFFPMPILLAKVPY